MKNKKHFVIGLLILTVAVAIDQFSKYLIVTNLKIGEYITLIDDTLFIRHIRNRGAAWSILESKTSFFIILTFIVIVFIIFLLYKAQEKESNLVQIGLVLYLAGTIGNLIDRISLHEVVDFVDFVFPIIKYDFPIFNVADMCLVIGFGCIAYDYIVRRKKSGR